MSRPEYVVIKVLRIVVAAAVLVLFYVSLSLTGPVYNNILKALTRLQFFPSLINVVLSGGGWFSAGFFPVALLTMLIGRLYCSVLCPLGIIQDVVIFISGKKRRRKYSFSSSGARLHGAIAIASLIGLLIGVPLLFGLLEPYAFSGRMYRDVVLPASAGASEATVWFLKEFNIFLAPLPFRGEIGAVLLTLVSAVLLVLLTYVYGRWFCNRLCPTGAVLRLLSVRPLWGMKFNKDLCTKCGVCAHVCPSGCIDVTAQFIEHNRCVMCFECTESCPFGAVDFKVLTGDSRRRPAGKTKEKKKREKGTIKQIDPDRRKAVMLSLGSLGAAGGLGLTGFSLTALTNCNSNYKPSDSPLTEQQSNSSELDEAGRAVIPPGSQNVRRYTGRCISCHTCVSVCPTHVLQPSFFALGVSGFLQPVMDYKTGYCEWECNRCSQICPTGAIGPIALEEKKRIQMGTVQFDKDRCVVFTEGTDCGACAEVCPSQAVRMVPYKNGLTQPTTEPEICSGCGSCEYACPVSLPKAIVVKPNTTHQVRSERTPQQTTPEEDVPEEFPF